MPKTLCALATLLIVFAVSAQAADVEIAEAWARATAGAGKNGVAYFTITNHGPDNAVIGALTSVSERAELHGHTMDGDVMRMRPVDSIDLPSGSTVTLAPGGLHVMLMGLTAPLTEGAWFPLSVELADGTTATTDVMVGGVGAMAPMDSSDHGHHE